MQLQENAMKKYTKSTVDKKNLKTTSKNYDDKKLDHRKNKNSFKCEKFNYSLEVTGYFVL